MPRLSCFPALLLVTTAAAIACDDGGMSGDDDDITADAAPGPDGEPGAADAGGADAAVESCGSEALPVASITGTEGLAMAPDGTLYYSQSGAVGRRLPGQAPEDDWVAIAGTSTIFGLALAEDGTLYVAAPSGTIFRVDTGAATPSAEPWITMVSSANGLVIGPDGAVYFTRLSQGRVYRADPQSGQVTQVTGSAVPGGANGIFFADASTLIVLSYQTGDVVELSLDAAMVESGRQTHAAAAGNPDGVARDETGRWYVSDNGAGRLYRYAADWSNREQLLMSVPAAANIVFGRGALDCHDIYVASSGTLAVYQGDAAGTP